MDERTKVVFEDNGSWVYRKFFPAVFILPAGSMCFLGAVLGSVCYVRYRIKVQKEQEKWQLMVEFKEAMDSMVSALAAGYSMENAITEAYRDMKLLHSEDTRMMRELWDIQQKISLHQPLDEVLSAFASKSGVEDIITFAQIYATARKSGGNLVKVMKRTAQNISEKMEIQREIQTMIAGKKMEAELYDGDSPFYYFVFADLFSGIFRSFI